MRNYRVEIIDPRDDSIINIESVRADLFIVDDAHVTVTFFVEKESTMVPVAMIPFQYVISILPDFAIEEGDENEHV